MDCSSLTGNKKLGSPPAVQYKVLKGVHGLAYPDHIELNQTDIDKLADDCRELKSFLKRVTIHELAHVAEYRISKVMSHGPGWHAFDTAGGGVGLQFGYVLDECDWEINEKDVGPAWAILQFLSCCAAAVLLLILVFYFGGCRIKWLGVPITALAFFASIALDAVCVKKAKNLEMFASIKFIILTTLAIYLMVKIGMITIGR